MFQSFTPSLHPSPIKLLTRPCNSASFVSDCLYDGIISCIFSCQASVDIDLRKQRSSTFSIMGFDLKHGYVVGEDPLLDEVLLDYDFGEAIWKY